MNDAWQIRTQLLLGDERMQRLHEAHVLVVGLGGVGAYAAEMLARSGVGTLTLVDADRVSESNINRQLIALQSTIGQPKAGILAALCAVFWTAPLIHADTDGTELQVLQPSQLEIQLGDDWEDDDEDLPD